MANQTLPSQRRVRALVEAAWRRSFLVLAVEQSGAALAALFAGVILLLLLGTQILNWRWVVLLSAVGLGLTCFRVRRRMLGRYAVAQTLDRRARLSDSLSTAWFLLEQPAEAKPYGWADSQIERAAAASDSVRLASFFPFAWRRSWAIALALGAVAFGLFALRYLVTSTLDLRASLVPLRIPFVAQVLEQVKEFGQHRPDGLRPGIAGGQTAPPPQPVPAGKGGQREQSKEKAPAAPKPGSGHGAEPSPDGAEAATAKSASAAKDAKSSGQKASDGKSNETNPSAADQPGDKPESSGSPDATEKSASRPSQSLTDRMKDAVSGMLAKMKPQSANQPRPQAQQAKDNGKSGNPSNAANQADSRNQQTATSSSRSQAQSEQQASAQGEAQAQASEKSAGAQSRASDESADRKGSDPHSGVGRQDGEKALKAAEQLKAMGKLDEIIGKRSADLTGEMTVETRSDAERLETQYSGRTGKHTDSGREIERNEVPVALQQYVREYMEQVRKQTNGQ